MGHRKPQYTVLLAKGDMEEIHIIASMSSTEISELETYIATNQIKVIKNPLA